MRAEVEFAKNVVMLSDLISKVLRCANSTTDICGKVFLSETFMHGFYRIKNVSHLYMSSGSVFGLGYRFINWSIKYMMQNKEPALCTASSFVPVETLWQKVSFSEGSDLNYLRAWNSDWTFFFGAKESTLDYSFIFSVYGRVPYSFQGAFFLNRLLLNI